MAARGTVRGVSAWSFAPHSLGQVRAGSVPPAHVGRVSYKTFVFTRYLAGQSSKAGSFPASHFGTVVFATFTFLSRAPSGQSHAAPLRQQLNGLVVKSGPLGNYR